MNSSYSMQAIVLALIIGLVMCAALPADYFLNPPMDKKSSANLREFMSAMQSAPRLRYGKRSASEFEANDYPVYPMRMMFEKRMSQNLPQLIDSLNGIEKLRFGK